MVYGKAMIQVLHEQTRIEPRPVNIGAISVDVVRSRRPTGRNMVRNEAMTQVVLRQAKDTLYSVDSRLPHKATKHR